MRGITAILIQGGMILLTGLLFLWAFNWWQDRPGFNDEQREKVAIALTQNGSGFGTEEAYCVADVLGKHYNWDQYSEKTTEEEIMTPEITRELKSECNAYYYPKGTPMTAAQREDVAALIASANNGLNKQDGYCLADVMAEHFSAREIAAQEDPNKLYTPEVINGLESKCGLSYN